MLARACRPIQAIVWFAFLVSILGAGVASARTVTDDAGRTVEVPDTVARVLAAGPPASTIVYTLAPEKLVG